MNAVASRTTSEDWWADQRAKRRTVVLVIVVLCYAWLTAARQLSTVEAAGTILIIGLVADVVDGTRAGAAGLSALLPLIGTGGR
jgi:hypothetical protein